MKNRYALISWIISILLLSVFSLLAGTQIFLGKEPSLAYFSAMHFSGYLFFLFIPVGLIFAYYLLQGESAILLIAIALATAIAGLIVDYIIGYIISWHFIHKMLGEKKYAKASKYLDNYGNLAIFAFNFLPLYSSMLALVAGMMRYRLRNLIVYSFLGLIMKYAAILLFFYFIL